MDPRLHQPDRPAVAQQDLAQRDRPPAHLGLPWRARHGQVDLGEDEVDDAVDDLVLVGEVVVERHRLDAEVLAEPAHAQAIEPALVGQPEGGLEDAVAGERLAALGPGSWPRRRLRSDLDLEIGG